MPPLFEEIKEILKLPPKIRLKKVKELKEKLKWLTHQEEEKRKTEEEEIVRKTIEEITEEEEEEEKKRKEELEIKPQETLEQIAEEAPKAAEQLIQQQYHIGSAYQTSQPRPIDELNTVISRTAELYQNKGIIPGQQLQQFEQARMELYQKKEQGYVPPDERARTNWQNTNNTLEEMRDPVLRIKKYVERR